MRFPSDSSFLWKVLYVVAEILKIFCCRVKVEGAENIPKTGGVILASNHNPGFDFVLMGYGCPRQVYFMAKKEIFDINPLLTKLLHAIGTFPIRRGARDQGAIQSAVDLVSSGKVLGMFPEGTRSRTGELQRAHSGAARIAIKANAPVVPTAIMGTEKIVTRKWLPWGRPLIIVRFGPPLYPPATQDGKITQAAARTFTKEFMCAVAQLLPPERRGAYADCDALDDE